jgi:hypothetical protein
MNSFLVIGTIGAAIIAGLAHAQTQVDARCKESMQACSDAHNTLAVCQQHPEAYGRPCTPEERAVTSICNHLNVDCPADVVLKFLRDREETFRAARVRARGTPIGASPGLTVGTYRTQRDGGQPTTLNIDSVEGEQVAGRLQVDGLRDCGGGEVPVRGRVRDDFLILEAAKPGYPRCSIVMNFEVFADKLVAGAGTRNARALVKK